ncbi:hypothetical protein QQP08_001025, partial [Theobroma cacao]
KEIIKNNILREASDHKSLEKFKTNLQVKGSETRKQSTMFFPLSLFRDAAKWFLVLVSPHDL